MKTDKLSRAMTTLTAITTTQHDVPFWIPDPNRRYNDFNVRTKRRKFREHVRAIASGEIAKPKYHFETCDRPGCQHHHLVIDPLE